MIINNLITLKNVVLKGTCKEGELSEFTKKWDDIKRKYSSLGIFYEVSRSSSDEYYIYVKFDIKECGENIIPIFINLQANGTIVIGLNGYKYPLYLGALDWHILCI